MSLLKLEEHRANAWEKMRLLIPELIELAEKKKPPKAIHYMVRELALLACIVELAHRNAVIEDTIDNPESQSLLSAADCAMGRLDADLQILTRKKDEQE